MTEEAARSSFNSDLKECPGSTGDAGPSVDGRLARLCCDAFTTGPSSGASSSTVTTGLATAASEADIVGVLASALLKMVARSGRSEARGSQACYAGRKRVRPRGSRESSNRASRLSDVDSSVLSGEGREKCVSCIFALRSHGGEVGRRVTEVFFDGGAAMGGVVVVQLVVRGGSEEEGVGRR